jgi:hypothetical protein
VIEKILYGLGGGGKCLLPGTLAKPHDVRGKNYVWVIEALVKHRGLGIKRI